MPFQMTTIVAVVVSTIRAFCPEHAIVAYKTENLTFDMADNLKCVNDKVSNG